MDDDLVDEDEDLVDEDLVDEDLVDEDLVDGLDNGGVVCCGNLQMDGKCVGILVFFICLTTP